MTDTQKRDNRKKEEEYNDSGSLYDIGSTDDDNLYTLPEDSDNDSVENENRSSDYSESESGYEDGDYEEEEDSEDDEEEDDDEDENETRRGNLFALMFKIMSTPVEGWKELKRRHYTVEELASGLFYPMIAFVSISEFADKFYTNSSISDCLLKGVGRFVSFFFGYFTVVLLSGIFLPKSVKEAMKKDIGKEFVMMNLSTMALFFMALNLFPMFDAILVFLPIWTIYLIYKGVRILRVPVSVESRTKVILTFLIIGAPLLWEWLMGLFLNF